jgi:serine phosphatase RsbU (regulator of sigma subunit)
MDIASVANSKVACIIHSSRFRFQSGCRINGVMPGSGLPVDVPDIEFDSDGNLWKGAVVAMTAASGPKSDLGPYRVLIVEDSDSQAHRLRLFLQAKGCEVWQAATGAEARALLFPAPTVGAPQTSVTSPPAFDLAVLDYWLPDMTGDILCRQIRAEQATCRLPVMLLTAQEGKATEISALGSGADDYVSKSASAQVLLMRLEALLRKSRAHSELRRRYEREHRVAAALQEALLSAPPSDAFPGLTIGMVYEPAWDEALVGGDFYDLRSVGATTAAFMVGDVSGKGLTAATLTAEVKYALRAYLHEDPDPGRALARLNDYLVKSAAQNPWAEYAYVTACLAVCDAATGKLWVSGAGAEPPLLLHRDRNTGVVCAESVATGDGMLLGVDRDETYSTVALTLKPGDVLLLFTDGITEARVSPGGTPLGYPETCRLVERAYSACCQSDSGAADISSLVRLVVSEAKRASGGRLPDDVCILAVQRSA